MAETEDRSETIISQLKARYPGENAFDLDGRSLHFVCEVEPTAEHPEYDRAVEVIISSKPHRHLKTTQHYTVISGALELHVENSIISLHPGDEYTVRSGKTHWARSENECWVEIVSRPGWTKEDHISTSNNRL